MQSKQLSPKATELEKLMSQIADHVGLPHCLRYNTVLRALTMCISAHAKQIDRDGKPHYRHSVRVALKQTSVLQIIIALLHDVVEDTDIEIKTINDAFGWRVAMGVEALSRGKEESWSVYIGRVCSNRDVIDIKIADIKDNISRGDAKMLLKKSMYDAALKKLYEARRSIG